MTMMESAVDPLATTEYAGLFRTLADPTRLAIVQHLAAGPHRVTDLVDHMGFAQSTISKHLSVLLERGLVSVRSEGRSAVYALQRQDHLSALISAAEDLLHAGGTPLSLCAHLRGTSVPDVGAS